MPDRPSWRGPPAWWATPLVGTVGGYLASLSGWPLPWMLLAEPLFLLWQGRAC